jgi:hypothetical protein
MYMYNIGIPYLSEGNLKNQGKIIAGEQVQKKMMLKFGNCFIKW